MFGRVTVEIRLITGNFYIFIRQGGETLDDLVYLNLLVLDRFKSEQQI